MSAEHTPGPWIWNKDRPAFYDLDWLTGANGERVLTIYGNGQMTPNKLLIAAAPDLLAACEQLCDLIAEYEREAVRDGEPCYLGEGSLIHARAAIVKARGTNRGE